jgi:hypothetical protein
MSWPTSPAPVNVKIRSYAPNLVSVTQSLDRDVRSRGAQRWLLEVSWPSMTRDEGHAFWVWLTQRRGQYTAADEVVAGLSTPRGTTGAFNPLVNGAKAAGSTTIATDGWGTGVTVLKAGDYLRFAGHNKVYQIVADAISNGSGQANLSIFPALVSALANNEAITVREVPFSLALVEDEQSMTMGPAYRWEPFTVSFVESI